MHSGLVHRSKQQLYPINFVGAPIGVGSPRLLLLVVISQLCLLALIGLLVGVKLHSVLGLCRHSMKRASYVRSNREMRPLTEA